MMLFISLCNVAQKPSPVQFRFAGTISHPENDFVYLSYDDNKGKRVKDSCLVTNGHFSFTGFINEPTLAIFKGNTKFMDDSENPNIIDLYIEPGNMATALAYNHFKGIEITGSKTQDEYKALQRSYATIDQRSPDLGQAYAKVNQRYILAHPDSYLSAHLLELYKTRWPVDTVKYYYAALSKAPRGSGPGKNIARVITEIDNNSTGKKANNFAVTDINGNPISLSDFRGKFVLLDFWGSWCVPCRESTPHLLTLFKKYHEKGLEVIGVAQEFTDSDKAWREAVTKDGTGIWHNLLDTRTKGEEQENNAMSIVKNYAISSFPTKILIDKEGIIVDRFIGGGSNDEARLDKKLEELFK